MTQFKLILPLALLLAALSPTKADDTANRSYLRAGDQIVCIGDSITAQGVFERYVEQALGALYPKAGITVINRGIGGQKSGAAVGILTDALKTLKPTVILVMFGVNDTQWSSSGDLDVKAKTFIDGLEKCRVLAKANNIPMILLRETSFNHGKDAGSFETAADTVLDRLESDEAKFAADNGIPFVDVRAAYESALHDAWKADPHYEFSPDIIHPTSPGHCAIAGSILSALGAGLPLSDNERGPVRPSANFPGSPTLQSQMSIGPNRDFHDVALVPDSVPHPITKKLWNTTVMVVGDRQAKLQGKQVNDIIGMDMYRVDLKSLPGRWGVVPAIVISYDKNGDYLLKESPYFYSRGIPAAKTPFRATAADFHAMTFPPPSANLAPVSDIEVSRDAGKLTVAFNWTDTIPVASTPGFKNRYGVVIDTPLDLSKRDAQLTDAVEILLDTRPSLSIGRLTSDIDSNPVGVERFGIYRDSATNSLMVQGLAGSVLKTSLTTDTAGRVVLTITGINDTPLGFTMRVTDASAVGKADEWTLTGTPGVSIEPMSYVRLGFKESDTFVRVGY